MAYIGNRLADSYTSFAKQDFTTSATTSYTLDYAVTNANEIALFINFVRQEPTTAYTATGTSLTLSSATSASDDMYAVFLGKALQTVNPPAGSVGLSQLSATGTASASTYLRGDNSWGAISVGTNTPAFSVTRSATQTTTNYVSTKIQFDTETFDTDNCFDSTTNYRFTPTTAGKYQFNLSIQPYRSNSNVMEYINILIKKNGTTELGQTYAMDTADHNQETKALSGILTANGSTDYFEAFVAVGVGSGSCGVAAGHTSTHFSGYKIIE